MNESTIEKATLGWLEYLSYDIHGGAAISPGSDTPLRSSHEDVLLEPRLRAALRKINDHLPEEAIDQAVRVITRPPEPTLEQNNRWFHTLLTDGVDVEYRTEDGDARGDKAWVVDFANPSRNDFMVVNQYTVKCGNHTRRADLVVFVNGLPMVVIELKDPTDEQADIWKAFRQLQEYKQRIPSLFVYNELMVISDGDSTRVGSLTAGADRFSPWRSIEDYREPGRAVLEVLAKQLFQPDHLLDYLRHCVTFEEDDRTGDIIKKVAGYHQFRAMRNACESVKAALKPPAGPGLSSEAPAKGGDGRGGVIWHTQGSGKSLTMLMLAGTLIGDEQLTNPTIVVVTDRNDLDGQLFGTFAAGRALLRQEPEQAESREDLAARLNRASGGVVFTTIQKFMPSAPSPRPSPSGRGSEPERPRPSCGGRGHHYRGGYDFAGLTERARELRTKETPAEAMFWELVRDRGLMGLKFRRQHQIGNYIADFYCHAHRFVVEFDGEVHGTRTEKDKKRDTWLRASGFTVLRFHNEELIQEPETVLGAITAMLDSKLPSTSGRGAGGEGPVSTRSNIVVMADEAHRSQYGFLEGGARWMRDAIPNATFVGFTGTPLEQDDRSTPAVFGDYADIYDIRQGISDNATVPIYYEMRLVKLLPDEQGIQEAEEEIKAIAEAENDGRDPGLYIRVQLQELAGAERRLKQVAGEIVEHFEKRREVIEGKGMIVCMSREICMNLYDQIVALRPDWHADDDDDGFVKVVMTGAAAEGERVARHARTKARREALARRFKNPEDDLRLVIVCDMWLTGFDCPPLHTMYLDKPLAGHNLMQTIARVNRVFGEKPGGVVVDFLGIADQLRDAVQVYTQAGGEGSPVEDIQDEAVPLMQRNFEVLRDFFNGFDYSGFFDGSEQDQLHAVSAGADYVFQQDDGKRRFMTMVAGLSKAFALAVPRTETEEIRDDLAYFQSVRAAIRKRLADDGPPPPPDARAAVRQVISGAIASDGVIDLFQAAGLPDQNVGILSDDFLDRLAALPHRNLALETLRKLLNDQIQGRERVNIVQSRGFRECLEDTLTRYNNRAITTAQVIEELIGLAKIIREAVKRGEESGLSEDEVAFYDALADNASAREAMQDDTLKLIARELADRIKAKASLDWTQRETVRADMRRTVRRLLTKYGYPPDAQEAATQLVIRQAELMAEGIVRE